MVESELVEERSSGVNYLKKGTFYAVFFGFKLPHLSIACLTLLSYLVNYIQVIIF